MIKFYVNLILGGLRKFAEIPKFLKEKVKAMLVESGNADLATEETATPSNASE